MPILTCSSKLQLLESALRRSLPQALPVHGAVMHINRGNPAQHEVMVDSWPEFKVVLTRPCREVVKDKWDYHSNMYAAFYWDRDACQALLEKEKVIDWGRAFQLLGLQDGLCDIIRGLVEAKPVHLESYNYQLAIHPDPSTVHPMEIKSDVLHIGTLKSTHAALLNENWDHGKNDLSQQFLENLINNFPNICLLDPGDQPVSWVLSDPVGSVTHGYTVPQYRGHGYVGLVLQRLVEKLHSRGFPLYLGVLADNQSSKKALKRQGFQVLPTTFYVLTVTPTFKNEQMGNATQRSK